MARKADGAGKVREHLEGALGALVDVEEVLPYVTLRITQAIRRAGLSPLLEPALQDIERIAASVCDAKSQVNEATVSLLEKRL